VTNHASDAPLIEPSIDGGAAPRLAKAELVVFPCDAPSTGR
jgi:hypothetical protein